LNTTKPRLGHRVELRAPFGHENGHRIRAAADSGTVDDRGDPRNNFLIHRQSISPPGHSVSVLVSEKDLTAVVGSRETPKARADMVYC
jgi:hypothetical protein